MDKVVLIGCGNVGLSYAYSLINSSVHVDELVLIDIFQEVAEGQAMDLTHACGALNKRMKIYAGSYIDCNNAKIVCICAGKGQAVGETRMDLIHKNYEVFKSIIGEINKTNFDGIYLVATNPLDIMTAITQKLSNFPKNKVIGSGTTLDTARLRSLISKELNLNPKNIHAYVIGEHGDSEFIPWSNAIIGLNKATDYINEAKREAILKEVRNSAYDIIKKKGNTCYGIGVCLRNITKAILEDTNSIMTVSAYDKYSDTFIGLPTVVGSDGAENVMYLELNEEEKAQLEESVKAIKSALNSLS